MSKLCLLTESVGDKPCELQLAPGVDRLPHPQDTSELTLLFFSHMFVKKFGGSVGKQKVDSLTASRRREPKPCVRQIIHAKLPKGFDGARTLRFETGLKLGRDYITGDRELPSCGRPEFCGAWNGWNGCRYWSGPGWDAENGFDEDGRIRGAPVRCGMHDIPGRVRHAGI
jgi:hypothetical protein